MEQLRPGPSRQGHLRAPGDLTNAGSGVWGGRLAAPDRSCRSAGGVAIASSPGSGCANATRVVCKPGPVPTPVARKPARIIHLGDALLRRSSTLTRMLTRALRRRFRAGHLRQHPYSSLLREGLAPPPVARLSRVGSYPTISTLPVPPLEILSNPELHRPSAVWFLLRFPSSHPGSPLATSLPFGARTFLPWTMRVHRRSSVHLRRRLAYTAASAAAKRGRSVLADSGRVGACWRDESHRDRCTGSRILHAIGRSAGPAAARRLHPNSSGSDRRQSRGSAAAPGDVSTSTG